MHKSRPLSRRSNAAQCPSQDAPQTAGGMLHFDPAMTLIRMPEVEALVGLARPTIYKMMRNPESGFPAPVSLSTSTARGAPVAWVLAEVQDWIRARITARGSAA